jgi:DNA-binding CsgD family transcriptional regulator
VDHVVRNDARENEQWGRIVSAVRGGIVFVDVEGRVVGMDSTAQQRLNGEARQLDLPIHEPDARAVECFVSAATLNIKGVPMQVCVIQEREPTEREVTTAMESVLADTSSFARSVIDRLKILRFAPSATQAEELDMLTDREKEILGLICQGKCDLQMSTELNVSHNTVRNHIASLYRKIGVNRRGAAILWARERGITGDNLRSRRRRHAPPDPRGL